MTKSPADAKEQKRMAAFRYKHIHPLNDNNWTEETSVACIFQRLPLWVCLNTGHVDRQQSCCTPFYSNSSLQRAFCYTFLHIIRNKSKISVLTCIKYILVELLQCLDNLLPPGMLCMRQMTLLLVRYVYSQLWCPIRIGYVSVAIQCLYWWSD